MSEKIETIIGLVMITTIIVLMAMVFYHLDESLTAPIMVVDRQIRYNDNRYRISNIEEQEDKIVLNVYKIKGK